MRLTLPQSYRFAPPTSSKFQAVHFRMPEITNVELVCDQCTLAFSAACFSGTLIRANRTLIQPPRRNGVFDTTASVFAVSSIDEHHRSRSGR
ncbi:hypothetical protein Pla100_39930 [Neorhodopirellula pilleata]|uniref:Uncharacterized protein n=1 Tax=Neorhodopirellula pilleata TaxID=2714738 RepID=A0A5C6A5P0_9BACT|nr:hypothetical protein Pla100_39930 [Neorhodopirellula pilleata]